MTDSFSNSADAVSAPARRAAAVTPSDSVALAAIPKALYIGSGGSVVARGVDDAGDVTFVNLAAGTILPLRTRYVRATGTSASDIVALY